jgi:hypothetical protein
LFAASSIPLKLLDATRFNTGETRRKNKMPLSAVRTKTNLRGKLGETGNARGL